MGLLFALGKVGYWSGVRVLLALARSSMWRRVTVAGLALLWIASGGRW